MTETNGEIKKLRLPTNCLQNVGPGAWQSHYETQIIGRDMKDDGILTPELFIAVRETLRAGDQVTICGYPNKSTERLEQFVTVRIVQTSRAGVVFKIVGQVEDVPYGEDEPKAEAEPDTVYTKRDFGGTFGVFQVKDDMHLEAFKTKKEAETAAARINAGGEL